MNKWIYENFTKKLQLKFRKQLLLFFTYKIFKPENPSVTPFTSCTGLFEAEAFGTGPSAFLLMPVCFFPKSWKSHHAKENMLFYNGNRKHFSVLQRQLWKFWENLKLQWKHSPTARRKTKRQINTSLPFFWLDGDSDDLGVRATLGFLPIPVSCRGCGVVLAVEFFSEFCAFSLLIFFEGVLWLLKLVVFSVLGADLLSLVVSLFVSGDLLSDHQRLRDRKMRLILHDYNFIIRTYFTIITYIQWL